MKVPFNDLGMHHSLLRAEIDQAINLVLEESSFIRGKHVDDFENAFASMMESEFCISCANGTDALYISMKALGLKSGEEVIVPAHSWISTSETVTQANGSIVFCDTDPETYIIDHKKIEEKITEKTVGIIPVHLFGQAANMEAINSIAEKHKLWIIEDCAQAHLAEYKGKKVGTFGNAGSFSFYPGKNLGAIGDAGAIVTSDKKIADNAAKFARHGGLVKGDHEIEGINSRMDGLQAAVLNVKLPYLKKWTRRRQKIAQMYLRELDDLQEIELPKISSSSSHVWHLFVIQHDHRNELKEFLNEKGISTIVNYPVSLPFLPAYSRLNHSADDFPISHRHQEKILSLPIFPEMNEDQVVYVCNMIKEFCNIER